MKICTICQQDKPLSEFSPHAVRGGTQSHCKVCRADKCRSLRARNRAREHIDVPEFKKCPRCDLTKRASSFGNSRSNKDGLYYHCKTCQNREYLIKIKRIDSVDMTGYAECSECERLRPKSEFYRRNTYCKGCANRGAKSRRDILRKDPFSEENQVYVARSMLNASKSGARKRKIEFDLSEYDILPLPKTCPVLAMPMAYMTTGNHTKNNTATLDRVDNDRGYVPGNVRIISFRANTIKGSASIAELEDVLAYMKKAA